MPNTVLNFRVENRHARADFHRLQQEIAGLEQAAGEMRREMREAGEAIDRRGDPSRTTAKALDTLGTAHSAYLQNVQRGLTAQARTLHTDIAALTAEIDGRTGPSVQGLNRQLREKRAALAEVQAQFGTHTNALRALTAANTRTTTTAQNASKATEHFARALAKLRANADATRDALTHSRDAQQFAATFQTATEARRAYDTERIRQAAAARAAEKAGSEAFHPLHVEIFQLGRQRRSAQRHLATESTHIARTFRRERVRREQSATTERIAGFATDVQAATAAGRARVAFAQQLAASPDSQSPDAPYGKPLTAGLRQDFQETERQGRSLLRLMQEIANIAYGTDVEERLPDPLDREVALDARIAAAARGTQVLTDMRQTAAEQGRHFLRRVHRSEARDTQQSLNARARHYRQFTNLVSKTFVDLAAGRTRSFESVATTFIEHSIRLMRSAVLENQLLKRLDDGLTAAKLANLRKVAAARAGSGLASSGGLGGLANLPGLGRLGSSFFGGGALSGGGFALGAASLLFPEQIRNITGGIADTLKGVLENVSHQPVVVKANIQNNLRIGDNAAREISDIQAEMRTEDRL